MREKLESRALLPLFCKFSCGRHFLRKKKRRNKGAKAGDDGQRSNAKRLVGRQIDMSFFLMAGGSGQDVRTRARAQRADCTPKKPINDDKC